MPTISLFFVLLSASFLLCGGLIAWIFLDRRHRRASQHQELRMTQQVLQHSALCEDLEVRITEAIAAFGENEDSFHALLLERNGLIDQLESAIASYESARSVEGAAAEQAPQTEQQAVSPDSTPEDGIASEISEGVLGIGDWEQQIESLQAEKHAELARQSETIAALTERVEALAQEAREAAERAVASARSAETSGQQGEVLQAQVDEGTARYEELEERTADETSKLRDDLELAQTEADRSSELGTEIEELREENTLLRDAQLAADGTAEQQLESLTESNAELSARAQQGDQDLALAQGRIEELEESSQTLQSGLDAQQALAVELEANLAEHAAQAAEWLATNATLQAESERLAAQAQAGQEEREALNEELTMRIGTLTAEKDHLAQTLGAREVAIVQLEQVSSATSGERDDAERRLETLEERLGSQARELGGMRSELQRLGGEAEQAEQARQSLQQESLRAGDAAREHEQLAVQEYESRLTDIGRERTQLTHELSQLRDELAQQASVHVQSLEDVSMARDQQQVLAGGFEQRVSELEDLARGRQEQLQESLTSAQSLADQITDLEGQLVEAGALRTTLDSTLRSRSEELEQKADSLADLQGAMGGLEELLETLTTTASTRDAELEQGREQVRQLEQAQQLNADALVAVGAREAAAALQITGLTESLTAASAEHEAISGALTEEQTALTRLRGEHKQVRGELIDARGDLKQRDLSCSELETQLAELGQQHTNVSDKLSARRDDLEQLKGAHALLGDDLSGVRADLEQEEQRGAALEQQLTSVQSELEQKQSELVKAQESLAARDSSFETAQDLLADLGPIFETLQSQLEKKNVLTALQSELRKPEHED